MRCVDDLSARQSDQDQQDHDADPDTDVGQQPATALTLELDPVQLGRCGQGAESGLGLARVPVDFVGVVETADRPTHDAVANVDGQRQSTCHYGQHNQENTATSAHV